MSIQRLDLTPETDQEDILLLALMSVLDQLPGKEITINSKIQIDESVELRMMVGPESVTFRLEEV